MAVPNNAYTNVQAYGVDYSVITEGISDAVGEVGQAMLSLQKQRQEAYERLQNAHAEYEDDTYLERAKGLDEAQNQAIRKSVDVSLVDFSNMSQAEKQKNIEKVKDIKAMQGNLEGILTMAKDQEVTLDAGLNPKWNLFAADLASMKNIEIREKKDGIGFNVVHKLTDANGKLTGDEEIYDESKINNVASMLRDVSPVLNSVEDKYNLAISKVQKNIDDWTSQGRNPSDAQIDEWTNQYSEAAMDGLTDQEKSIYYSNMVNKGDLLVPNTLPINGKEVELSPEKKEEIRRLKMQDFRKNASKYIKDGLVNKLPQYEKPSAAETKGRAKPEDIAEVSKFKEAHARMKVSEQPTYLNQYTVPLGYEVKRSKDGETFDIYATNAETALIIKESFDSSMVDEESINKLRKNELEEKLVAKIPINDDELFYKVYQTAALGQKGRVADLYGWVNHMDKVGVPKSFYDEVEALKQEKNKRVGADVFINNESSGNKDVSKMTAAEKIEYYKNLK